MNEYLLKKNNSKCALPKRLYLSSGLLELPRHMGQPIPTEEFVVHGRNTIKMETNKSSNNSRFCRSVHHTLALFPIPVSKQHPYYQNLGLSLPLQSLEARIRREIVVREGREGGRRDGENNSHGDVFSTFSFVFQTFFLFSICFSSFLL